MSASIPRAHLSFIKENCSSFLQNFYSGVSSGMTEDEVSKMIRMAWEDRTSFEEIYKRTKLTESDVIKIMRNNLKPASFKR